MDARTLLSKVVILIYHSRNLNNLDHDDLIRTNLDTIKTDTPDQNFMGNNAIKKFKDYCIKLLEEREPIPKENVLLSLSIILENDQKLLQSIKDSIEPERDENAYKRILSNLIKTLNSHYKETLAIRVISKANYDLTFNRSKVGNFSEYLRGIMAELEPLSNVSTLLKDPAIVSEVDFENDESIETVFEDIKNLNSESGVYRLGWQDVNNQCQGGVRRGETVSVGALQHKYKTGWTLSIFSQIATLNKPLPTREEIEKGKKPLLLRISFEDNLTNNLQFLYQYLKANEGNIVHQKDFSRLSSGEMSKYVKQRLTATGFHVKMLRVDPTQWNYSALFNKVIEFEAQGYAVHVLMVDYLFKMPTTGCIQGPIGSDKRDLLRRVRAFTSARNITFISPFQLSTDAKQLIRNGTPEHQLVNMIAEQGYYDGVKTIDQEIDLELYIHLFYHKRKKYLTVRRGKHRLPTVIAEEDKYSIYVFPGLNVPILEDIDRDNTAMKTLPKGNLEETVNSSIVDELDL